jgi:hypothetical protein
MKADLPLPDNSFVLDQIELSYSRFDEAELGRLAIKEYFDFMGSSVPEVKGARMRPYLSSSGNIDWGSREAYYATFWIVAHFKTDDEGVWFMLKHNIQPKRVLRVDKMSSQWLRHKNKLDAFENDEYK